MSSLLETISIGSLSAETVALAKTVYLESPYKPFLLLLPFIPWAWLIGSRLDKDARYFHFNATMWNSIHLAAGALAMAAMFLVPIFWIGWPLGIVLLASPVFVYWWYRNQNVPESQRFALSGAALGERMEARRQAKAVRDAILQFIDAKGETRDVPLKDDPAFGVHMQVEDLLGPAVDARASMIEMNVGQSGCTISQMIDGIRYKRDPMTADAGLRVADMLKDFGGLDVADRRRRQTGQCKMRGPRGTSELEVTTAGSSKGLLLRVEFDRAKRLLKPFDDLGLLPVQMERLGVLLESNERHGVVLLGAPTGHGLTTTCYSFLSRHDAYTSNIKTLERRVKLRLDGVDHVEWDASNQDVDFATNLQSILRRDPDVVLVGDMRDQATAKSATDPGMDGPLIYVPLRQPTIAETIRAWVKIVGDLKPATNALRAVVNQRLLRKLCPNCRQAYQPSAEQLKKLSLPAKNVTELFRPGGKVQVKNKIENCPVCGGTGYLGQTGIFEIFVTDGESRKHLAAGDLKAALNHARRNKMIYLQEAALSKVASGETTIEEVVRVTTPQKSSSGSAAKPAAAPAASGTE